MQKCLPLPHTIAITIMKKITIAIDGLSSCGKSTMAKNLAKRAGYTYIDTGAMYRAVTLHCLRQGLISPDGEVDLERLRAEIDGMDISFKPGAAGARATFLNGENVEEAIRSMDVSANVSHVSAIPFVREALVKQQQKLGAGKGVVMDGRDIGTTVFPDAELKIFVTADDMTRAKRRYDEMKSKGIDTSLDEVAGNIRQRDRIDQTRQTSPLRKADDAIAIDNSNMTIEEQDEYLFNLFAKVAGYDDENKD